MARGGQRAGETENGAGAGQKDGQRRPRGQQGRDFSWVNPPPQESCSALTPRATVALRGEGCWENGCCEALLPAPPPSAQDGPFPSQLVGIELWGWEGRLSLGLGVVGRRLDGSGQEKPRNQRTEERRE